MSPAPGGIEGWIITTAGTFGTLNSGATTGSINSGSIALSVNSAAGLTIGSYISIAGVTGTKRVLFIDGTDITIDFSADATVSDAAIGFVAPTVKTYGAIDS
jgi:hypothetical protein